MEDKTQLPNLPATDHDLLITLHVQMQGVRTDIQNLTTNSTGRITAVELGKLDKEEAERRFGEINTAVAEQGKQIQWLQRIAYGAVALLLGVEFYFNYLRK